MGKTFPDKAVLVGPPKLRELLSTGVDIHERDSKGRTALFRVCRVGSFEKTVLLLGAGADPNATDNQGEAPLQVAARYGHSYCVRVLLKAGANIDYCPPASVTSYSESALCSAARKSPEVARLLLELGANPDAATAAKNYPLLSAISAGDEELVQLLLNSKAAVNVADLQGRTALHRAVEARKPGLIKLFVGLGADPNAKDERGDTPLFTAMVGYESTNIEVVRQLLAAKPDLTARNKSHDQTALEWAIEFDQREVAGLLREAGSPPPRKPDEDAGCVSLEIEVDAEDLSDEDEASDSAAERDGEAAGETLRVAPEDKALAIKCQASVTSLVEYQDWKLSPPHWEMLRVADKLISLTRMTYFARGHLNQPKGKEFDDGPTILGESYLSAIERFVRDGLLERVRGAVPIDLSFSSSELERIALQHNIKATGTKSVLAARLWEQVPAETFQQRFNENGGYYILTEAGTKVSSERQSYFKETERRLRKEILASLEAGDLEAAAQLARVWHLQSSRPRLRKNLPDAERIAGARFLLRLSIPKWLGFERNREDRLRAILSAQALCDEWNATWETWDKSFSPTTPKGRETPLRELSLYLLENGQAFRGWDWEKEINNWKCSK